MVSMNRIPLLRLARLVLLVGLTLGLPRLALSAPDSPPNIIVMLADDQGWGDMGIHGHPSIHTPHLDQLARDGAQFNRFYVQPVCAPTRAEFLTGRYHLRGGVRGVSEGLERLAVSEETIANVFKAAGYATGSFGKWHNGSQGPFHPNARGFDEFYGFTSGHWGNYFDAMMDHNGRVVTGTGFLTDDITSHTIDFARQNAEESKPFFAYLAFNTPHSPMQVPDAYWESWNDRDVPRDHRFAKSEKPVHTRAALAMVENIDHNVGRLLVALEQLNIAENTIVIYFTDNGPNGARWNGDMKGRKGSTDEGGVRSPLFMRWPSVIKPGTHVQSPSGAIDLLPSLVELADIPHSPKNPLDGLSLASAVTQGSTPQSLENRRIYSHWNGRISSRGSRWLIDHEGELFDLSTDPLQYRAVTRKHPDVAADLRADLASWQTEILASAASSKPAITVGYAGAQFTPLPARDATLHGTLERSNKYPNDSYVRRWTQPDDHLTWAIDIPSRGRFAVEVYYTCPAEDVGSLIELQIGSSTISTRINHAWDPPELGAEHDRFPRQESYVKNFRTLSLGEIDLSAGPGEVMLSCPEIPGSTALEFRLLTFERLD